MNKMFLIIDSRTIQTYPSGAFVTYDAVAFFSNEHVEFDSIVEEWFLHGDNKRLA